VGNKKLRILTLSLSLVLIVSAFVVGCAPQQRPVPDRYGTRYYMNDNRADTRYNTGYNTRFDTGYNSRSPYDYGQGNTGDGRLYGFFGNGDRGMGSGYDNIPRQGMMSPTRTANNSDQVNRMQSSCNKINGVTDCTVVRDGDTCYVGCNTAQGTNENTAALRTQCANKIRQVDPSVKKVVVTVDPNKITKLRNMVRDTNMGRPTRSFINDLENLFR
jgi:YhcN/YlaJ family sporulation lipoprotein